MPVWSTSGGLKVGTQYNSVVEILGLISVTFWTADTADSTNDSNTVPLWLSVRVFDKTGERCDDDDDDGCMWLLLFVNGYLSVQVFFIFCKSQLEQKTSHIFFYYKGSSPHYSKTEKKTCMCKVCRYYSRYCISFGIAVPVQLNKQHHFLQHFKMFSDIISACVNLPIHSAAIMTVALARMAVAAVVVEVTDSLIYLGMSLIQCSRSVLLKRRAQLW